MDSINYLRKLIQKNNYLLHGSPCKSKILKPKIPEGTSPNAFIKKGIYATDVPEIAIFISILNSNKIPKINGVKKWFTLGIILMMVGDLELLETSLITTHTATVMFMLLTGRTLPSCIFLENTYLIN